MRGGDRGNVFNPLQQSRSEEKKSKKTLKTNIKKNLDNGRGVKIGAMFLIPPNGQERRKEETILVKAVKKGAFSEITICRD